MPYQGRQTFRSSLRALCPLVHCYKSCKARVSYSTLKLARAFINPHELLMKAQSHTHVPLDSLSHKGFPQSDRQMVCHAVSSQMVDSKASLLFMTGAVIKHKDCLPLALLFFHGHLQYRSLRCLDVILHQKFFHLRQKPTTGGPLAKWLTPG